MKISAWVVPSAAGDPDAKRTGRAGSFRPHDGTLQVLGSTVWRIDQDDDKTVSYFENRRDMPCTWPFKEPSKTFVDANSSG